MLNNFTMHPEVNTLNRVTNGDDYEEFVFLIIWKDEKERPLKLTFVDVPLVTVIDGLVILKTTAYFEAIPLEQIKRIIGGTQDVVEAVNGI